MFDHYLFQIISNGLRIAGQHRSLIDHTNSLQVFFYIKAFRILAFEFCIKLSMLVFHR